MNQLIETVELIKAAIDYANKGFPVFPCCWPDVDGHCGCGRHHEDRSAGKVPLTAHGLQDATTDLNRLSAWWGKYPNSNLAVAIPKGYFVLDIDIAHNGYESLAKLQRIVGELPDTLLITTGSGGSHYWFTTTEPVRNTVALAGLEGLDIRGIGGYVVTAPSLHRTGGYYKIAENRCPAPAPQALIDLVLKATPSNQSIAPAIVNAINEGGRNHTLASLGGTMRRRGMELKEIETSLLAINLNRCNPPLPEDQVRKIAASVSRYIPDVNAIPNGNVILSNYNKSVTHPDLDINVTQNVTQNVTEFSERVTVWISETKGRWFETQEIDRELGIISQKDKDARRQKLHRMENDGVIERHPKTNKMWRFVDQELVELNYKTLPVTSPLNIVLPLGLSHLVKVFAGNLIVLAGSPNSGKTAVALELIKLNNEKDMPVYYFYSEGGDIELRNRLDNCEGMDINEWNFRAFSRSVDFADVIAPGCLNVVDYLEVTDNFYSVAEKLTAICNKNTTGLSVVCLQKNAFAKMGRGGSFSLEKARLYIAFDEAEGVNNAQAEIIKAKSWAVKGYNPNHLKTTFHIQNGWIENNAVDWSQTGGEEYKIPKKKEDG